MGGPGAAEIIIQINKYIGLLSQPVSQSSSVYQSISLSPPWFGVRRLAPYIRTYSCGYGTLMPPPKKVSIDRLDILGYCPH